MNRPRIGFDGFKDEWRECRLGELWSKSGSGGTPLSSKKEYYDGSIPFLGISDLKGRYIVETEKHITKEGLNNSAAWIVPKGSISFAMYASVGKLGILNIDAATSQAFLNMVFDNSDTRDFIYTTLERAEFKNQWKKLISTGTQPNLNAEKLKGFKILLPSLPEQRFIGSFFRSLDDLISSQEARVKKLKRSKHALLSLLFPENDCVPRLRFPGFKDEWRECRLDELVTYVSSDLTAKDAQDTGLYNLYDANNIIGKTNKSRIDTEYISIIKDGSGIGRIRRLPKNSMFIATMGGIITEKADLDFIYALLSRFNPVENYTGSAIPHIYFSNYGSKEYLIPSLSEQRLIGSLFRTLDTIIESEEFRLRILKGAKKALLSGMFV